MNLHLAVRGMITAVNPDIIGQLLVSTGSTKNVDYSRAPTYAAPVTLPMNVQPLTPKEVEHVDSLNIQAVTRSVFVNGIVQCIDRASGKGGDLIQFSTDASVPAHLQNTIWKAMVAFEQWDRPGWTKVGIQKQLNPVENNA